MGLRKDGSLVCWGANRVPPKPATNIVAIAAGARHELALRADGVLLAWGNSYYGQTDVPAGATNLTSVAAGAYHSLALVGSGNVLTWGADDSAQTDVPAAAVEVRSIAGGWSHTIALLSAGVRPGPLSLELWPPKGSQNASLIRLTGLIGKGRSTLYVSSDLENWVPVCTNLPTLGPVQCLDGQGFAYPQRLYRAAEVR